MDVFMAFLLIILALAIVSIFGGGTDKVILAITIPFIPRYARVVRSNALAIREIPMWMPPVLRVFVSPDHSLAHGAKLDSDLPDYAYRFCGAKAILTEACLSLLGIGMLQKPKPAWGLMLQGGAEYAENAPWVPIFPGLAITLAVLRFYLFGDAVRDTLDPRLRSQ